MDETKYAILAISESWLNSSLKNAEAEIDGFSFQDWTGRETQRISLVVGCARTCSRPRSLKYIKTYPEYHCFSPIVDASSAENTQVILALRHLQAS